jgi:hypothetical protein
MFNEIVSLLIKIFTFSFPRNPYQRRQWKLALNRLRYGSKDVLWEPKARDVVCSKHFREDDFYFTGRRTLLKKTAIPSVKRSDAGELALSEGPSLPRPSQASLREENEKLRNRLAKQSANLRNTRKRETRLRRTLGHLVDELEEQKFINGELKAQLDDFRGKIIYLFLIIWIFGFFISNPNPNIYLFIYSKALAQGKQERGLLGNVWSDCYESSLIRRCSARRGS